MTAHRVPRLRVAPQSVQRIRTRIRAELRKGRGRRPRRVLADLAPIIRGWTAYFRLAEVKAAFETLDQWLRRRLRCLLWRQRFGADENAPGSSNPPGADWHERSESEGRRGPRTDRAILPGMPSKERPAY